MTLGAGDLPFHKLRLRGSDGLKAGGRGNAPSVLEADFQAFFREGENVLRKFCRSPRAIQIRSTSGIKQQTERFFSLVDRSFGKLAQFGFGFAVAAERVFWSVVQ